MRRPAALLLMISTTCLEKPPQTTCCGFPTVPTASTVQQRMSKEIRTTFFSADVGWWWWLWKSAKGADSHNHRELGSNTTFKLLPGYYTRGLITRVGKLELRVPQDRGGRFSTEIFERYQRSEKALVSCLAEMYVQGVSTRKVKAITEELCGHSFSASTSAG
jgi:Transposase, Mutator family